MRKLPALVAMMLVAALAAGEPIPVPEPPKPSLPFMGEAASFPALYSSNNENWVTVAVRMGSGIRTINAKARNMPELMRVRPGDKLNIVTQEDDGQDWVLSVAILDANGEQLDDETSESDVITGIERTAKVVTVKTRRGQEFRIDRRGTSYERHDGRQVLKEDWTSSLAKNQVASFKFMNRDGIKWAHAAILHNWSGRKELQNPHADEQVVVRIETLRVDPNGQRANNWWYYIQTQFPKVRYEVDSRWNRDVRLQRVGQPPLWHKDKEPSPFSETAVLSGPAPASQVNVEIEGDTLSNNLSAGISSSNNVTSVNENRNSNTSSNVNSNSNSNDNRNTNQNSNQNQNSNDNRNTNQNQNSNSNDNNNDNRNSNDLTNQNNLSNEASVGR